ncbi:MAG TPA: hypothetical protein VF595_00390 [Tepidisphaeraceae bacterium]|jgi:hypothetical protein
MKNAIRGLSAALLVSIVGVGCASRSQEGVTSTYRTQSVSISADVETTTAAARSVFEEDKLTDVSAESTKLDGMASGLTADKTKIQAKITKTNNGSDLYVTVGKVGSPEVGANYAAKIKQMAEKK